MHPPPTSSANKRQMKHKGVLKQSKLVGTFFSIAFLHFGALENMPYFYEKIYVIVYFDEKKKKLLKTYHIRIN